MSTPQDDLQPAEGTREFYPVPRDETDICLPSGTTKNSVVPCWYLDQPNLEEFPTFYPDDPPHSPAIVQSPYPYAQSEQMLLPETGFSSVLLVAAGCFVGIGLLLKKSAKL